MLKVLRASGSSGNALERYLPALNSECGLNARLQGKSSEDDDGQRSRELTPPSRGAASTPLAGKTPWQAAQAHPQPPAGRLCKHTCPKPPEHRPPVGMRAEEEAPTPRAAGLVAGPSPHPDVQAQVQDLGPGPEEKCHLPWVCCDPGDTCKRVSKHLWGGLRP